MKEIKRRVQSLSGVLASPASEGDYAEKGRRVELRRFVLVRIYVYQSPHPSLRKLEGVIANLEPLSDQHAFVGFLRNADNAKTLGGFVQDLADAITDYQVRTVGPTVIFTEHPLGFSTTRNVRKDEGNP